MFLCVPVFVLDRTLRNIFGSLRTSLDIFGYYGIPTKNLGTLKIKKCHAYKCKKVGRYNSVELLA